DVTPAERRERSKEPSNAEGPTTREPLSCYVPALLDQTASPPIASACASSAVSRPHYCPPTSRRRTRAHGCGRVMLGAHPHDHSCDVRTDFKWSRNPVTTALIR